MLLLQVRICCSFARNMVAPFSFCVYLFPSRLSPVFSAGRRRFPPWTQGFLSETKPEKALGEPTRHRPTRPHGGGGASTEVSVDFRVHI